MTHDDLSSERIQATVESLLIVGAERVHVMGALVKSVVLLARQYPKSAIQDIEGAIAALSEALRGFRALRTRDEQTDT